MNALTPTAPAAMAQTSETRRLALEDAIVRAQRELASPHGDLGAIITATPAVSRDAAEALAHLQRLLAPRLTAKALAAWLAPVAMAVRDKLAPAEFAARCGVLAMVFPDTPACVLNANTQAEAIRRFAWFPSGADLAALFAEAALPLLLRADALRRIANAPQPEPPQVVTPEERANILAGFCTLKAELRKMSAEAAGPVSGPVRYHPSGAMPETRQRAGNWPESATEAETQA